MPVPQKMRWSAPSVQYATPRWRHVTVIVVVPSSWLLGLCTQMVSPVCASTATPWDSAVLKYRTPSIISGVACIMEMRGEFCLRYRFGFCSSRYSTMLSRLDHHSPAVGRCRADVRVGRLPAPGHLEIGEVAAVDLIERRILGGALVRGVAVPLAAAGAALRPGVIGCRGDRSQHGQRRECDNVEPALHRSPPQYPRLLRQPALIVSIVARSRKPPAGRAGGHGSVLAGAYAHSDRGNSAPHLSSYGCTCSTRAAPR